MQPNHFELGQSSVDRISLEALVGPIVVIDIRQACQHNEDYRLSPQDLKKWGKRVRSHPLTMLWFLL